MYYQLRCIDCEATLKEIVATEPGELLNPDREQAERQLGERLAGKLFDFHAAHGGHRMEYTLSGYPTRALRIPFSFLVISDTLFRIR